jgi:hypothetical protein
VTGMRLDQASERIALTDGQHAAVEWGDEARLGSKHLPVGDFAASARLVRLPSRLPTLVGES